MKIMKKKSFHDYLKMDLLLFDVDNTLVHSGEKISTTMKTILGYIHSRARYDLGVVGGGTYDKIRFQLDDFFPNVTHVFSECGCVYHKNGILQYKQNLRDHKTRPEINKIIQRSLEFMSKVPYLLEGHMIDFRDGIVYISLLGMSATEIARETFINNYLSYRQKLLDDLLAMDINGITIRKGGSMGIAVFPEEWNKTQVLEFLQEYNIIYYIGDSFTPDGNDYELIYHPRVNGIKVNNPGDTLTFLYELI